jgi:glycosyltransferase involved in cell wall biosynthesis
MRIFLLSTSMGMGGADQQILILARAMRARGHEVRIVALAPLGAMGLEAQREGIPTESLELKRNIGVVPRVFRLARMVRAWRPDVLMAPVPALISTIHSVNDGGPLRMAAYRLTSGLVDRYTIISRLAAERYVGIGAVPAQQLEVVPNAVDTERFRHQPQARETIRRELGVGDGFVWIAVGRFEEPKDCPTMIAAFARLASQRPASRLLLVGKGSLQDQVERLVQAAGLTGRVHFLGVRRDVAELMSAADGYVLSSNREGMPVVLLEAAAIGLPIVATRVGGIPEVVEDGVTGLLVPPGDDASLMRAMDTVEDLDPEARRSMGSRGRALVEQRYGTRSVMEQWDRLYSEFATASRATAVGQW